MPNAPPLVLSSALPSEVAPSAKVTVSFAGGAGETVTVNVTSWPKTDGVPDEWTEVVVAIGPLVDTVTGWLFGLSAPVQLPWIGVTAVGYGLGQVYNWDAEPSDVAQLIHPHPTQSEAIGEAHLALAGKPLHVHA